MEKQGPAEMSEPWSRVLNVTPLETAAQEVVEEEEEGERATRQPRCLVHAPLVKRAELPFSVLQI